MGLTVRSARSGLLVSIFVTGFFLFAGFAAIFLILPPSPKPASAPAAEFSAFRAMEHSKATARVPHPMGSAANAEVRAFIVAKLKEFGVEVEEQISRHLHGDNTIDEATSVIGRTAGTANTKAFALMAHFDSVPYGPGAADDGSGVVTLLETARALKAGPPLRNDIIFIFTDGEEAGEVGAQAFMRSARAEQVGLILNFEARGTSGPSLMFETSAGNGWQIRELARAKVHARASSLTFEVYKRIPFGTDFTSAKRRGLKGFNFAFIEHFSWYHTRNDTPEHLSLASLQNHGTYALGLARHFGNLPLDGDLTRPDVVYFNSLGPWLVYYPMTWSGPIAWTAAAVFLAMVILGLAREHVGIVELLGGMLALGLTAMVCAMSTLVALAFVYGPRKLFVQYTTDITHLPDLGAFHHNTLYGWAFAALTMGVFIGCYQALCRRIRVESLAAGALAWWVVILAVMQRFLPGGGYLAAWPLLFAALGLTISFLRRPGAASTPSRVFMLGWLALPGILFLAPAYHVLLATVMIMTAPLLVLVIVLMLSLLIPQFPLMTSPNRWWLPAGALAVALVMLTLGVTSQGYTAERPKLNCLAYGLNFDTGRAAWFSSDEKLDEWTSRFLQPNGSRAKRGTIGEYLTGEEREYWKAPAPVAPYQGPQATLVSDTTRPEGREVTMRLAVPDRPLEVRVRLVSDNKVHWARVYDQQVPGGGKGWSINFRGFPAAGTDLKLLVDATAPLSLKVEARLLGLPSFPGLPPRPEHMAPEPNTIRRPWPFRSDHVFLIRTFDFPGEAAGLHHPR